MRKSLNILISAWSNEKMFSVKGHPQFKNPKNYPFWRQLVALLRLQGHRVIQIGLSGEKTIGANGFLYNKSLGEIAGMIPNYDLWLSVDNFLPHLVKAMAPEKQGIVIFSRSDPKIYGYEENINILVDKKYLRPDQFGLWWNCEFILEAFPDPELVFSEFLKITKEKTLQLAS